MTQASSVSASDEITIGIGLTSNATPSQLALMISSVFERFNLDGGRLKRFATIDRLANHPAIHALGIPVLAFSIGQLSEVEVPNPSELVAKFAGSASVAEAAALLGAGPGSVLVVAKQTSSTITLAVAVGHGPPGSKPISVEGP